MAAEITITPDPVQLREIERLLSGIDKGTERALASAVSKTATGAAASTRRRMVPILGLKLKDLKKRISVAKPKKLVAIIRLSDFNIKATKAKGEPDQGKEFAFSQKGDLHPLPATWFRQTVPSSGHTAYFVRSEKDASKATRRLPIQELHIASPRKGWEQAPDVAEEELRKARVRLSENVASQIDRLLNRKKADR